jgi:hypothetical protein
MITIGTASVGPGERGAGFLKVGELNDGSSVNIPIIIVNGWKEGPTLWIVCCMHGNEVASSYALLKTLKEIDPAKLRGTLIGAPVLNVHGFNMGVRNTVFDPMNLNRMPGDAEGSFTEQYANVIYETIKANADYVVDAHGRYAAGGSDSVEFVFYNSEADVADKSREFAKSSAIEIIVADGSEGVLNKALYNVIANEGIPAVCTESDKIETLHQAFTNFLKYLGMIEGKLVPPRYQKFYKELYWQGIAVKRGGLFHPKVKEKDEVSKGQLIGVVTNLFGEEVEKITSPIDGFVLDSPGYHPVKTGDRTFMIVTPE